MGWVYLDDRFPEHPKVAAAGPNAAWLFVCGLAYTNRNNSYDGIIPKAIVPRLSDLKQPAKLAARLVNVGLWHDKPDHYQVHDYGLWNEPAIRRRAAARKGADARWHADRTADRTSDRTANRSAEPMPSHMPSHSERSAEPMHIPSRPTPSSSNPSPTDSVRGVDEPGENTGTGKSRTGDPPLVIRLAAACSGTNRQRVETEAGAVVVWARQHVDDRLVDEAIGVATQLAEPPVLPRAIARIIRDKAGSASIRMPSFEPTRGTKP